MISTPLRRKSEQRFRFDSLPDVIVAAYVGVSAVCRTSAVGYLGSISDLEVIDPETIFP